jgi:hypothetical protein
MGELKTKQHDGDVAAFICNFANSDQKKTDSFALVEMLQDLTGREPKMWGETMIGFGKYHYKSERSSQEGDWMRVGFSPRKAAISLYIYVGTPEQEQLLSSLGTFKMGKACIYVKRLADIDLEVLKQIILLTLKWMDETYGKE